MVTRLATSLYEHLFNEIPMFAVQSIEGSDVVEYETSMQRTVRLLNETKTKQQMEEIARLRNQLAQVDTVSKSRKETNANE